MVDTEDIFRRLTSGARFDRQKLKTDLAFLRGGTGEEKKAGGQSVTAALDFFGDLTSPATPRHKEGKDLLCETRAKDKKSSGKKRRKKGKCEEEDDCGEAGEEFGRLREEEEDEREGGEEDEREGGEEEEGEEDEREEEDVEEEESEGEIEVLPGVSVRRKRKRKKKKKTTKIRSEKEKQLLLKREE
ncbi:hypothetical protein GBAR_LOCUS3118, partial [Geodia barretti]